MALWHNADISCRCRVCCCRECCHGSVPEGGKHYRTLGGLTMAELNMQENETIQRALGIIEGISCGVSDGAASMLITSVEMIDGVLVGDGK